MRAIVYARASLDRNGEQLSVTRQVDDGTALCATRGWTVIDTVVDNDTSASTGKPRPGFTRVLDAVDNAAVDVVVVWAVDRLVRRVADLEDVIERCETAGVRLATVSGDLDLSTDTGRLVARILASVARGEVERKGTRQRRANIQAAEAGKPPSGPVGFGFQPDRITHEPAQAAAVADAYDTILAGGKLRSIARRWNEAGLTSGKKRTGRQGTGQPSQWRAETVRALLLNPRNAGLRSYRGEIIGRGVWEPIVDEATWRAAVRMLCDPQRRGAPPTPRHLLSGVALCGICGAPVNAGTARPHYHAYRCGASLGHVARRGDHADDYVAELVVERLSRPDAVELLTPSQDAPDVPALRAEATTARTRLSQLAEDYADGTLDRAQLRVASERLRGRIEAIDTELAEASRVDVLASLVGVDDVQLVWGGMDTDQQRAVIDTLMQVRLHPVGQGARRFDPGTIEITWRVVEP